MKKKILFLLLGLLLIGTNLYAAGDLIVNGNLGIGTSTPSVKFEAVSTDVGAFKSNTTKSTEPGVFIDGASFALTDSSPAHTKGWNVLSILGDHTGDGTSYQNLAGAIYRLNLKAITSDSILGNVYAQQNNVNIIGTSRNYTISTMYGNQAAFLISGSGTYNVTNLYAYQAIGNFSLGTKTLNVTNMVGLKVDDWGGLGIPSGIQTNVAGIIVDAQTMGTNKMGIWLNGNGTGADVVFGPNREARIYSSGGRLYAQDSAFNKTILSPHDPETGEWIYYSKNIKTGKVVRVNMEQLVKAVEKLTGEKFLIETIEEGN